MLHSRLKRVNTLLRNEISEIVQHEIKDPRLGFVTIPAVEVSKDLRRAIVHVSVLSDDPEEEQATMEALEHARGYIKALLSDRVVLKFMPDLEFHLHEGARHATRIDQILKELSAEKPEGEEEDE